MKSESDRNREINEKLRLRPDSWPHQFVKDGKLETLGEDRFWQPMICKHCYKRFTSGRDQMPTDKCPARNDKIEIKRILNR